MARFYADENFPLPVVQVLRQLGHDVLTVGEAGKANLQEVPPPPGSGSLPYLIS